MNNALIHQRCFNHALREAAARCPVCEQFYCRECITEHDERVICATCLGKIMTQEARAGGLLAGFVRVFQVLAGLAAACVFFYLTGRTLLLIDTSVHEGTVWKGSWFSE